jgi:acyl carrier protein
MPENLRDRVITTVRQVLGPNVDIGNTKLQLSSLKMLELIVALETEFRIQISEDDPMAEITASVDAIVKHLESTFSTT